jgi:hypothetical protein
LADIMAPMKAALADRYTPKRELGSWAGQPDLRHGCTAE